MAFSETLWSTLKRRKLSCFYYLFYWVDRDGGGGGGGVGRIVILKFWVVKRGHMNESGPAGIEVWRIFGQISVRSCLGPLVVHLWKGTTTFGLILALFGPNKWIVNWIVNCKPDYSSLFGPNNELLTVNSEL